MSSLDESVCHKYKLCSLEETLWIEPKHKHCHVYIQAVGALKYCIQLSTIIFKRQNFNDNLCVFTSSSETDILLNMLNSSDQLLTILKRIYQTFQLNTCCSQTRLHSKVIDVPDLTDRVLHLTRSCSCTSASTRHFLSLCKL